jgi:hypothetical protein
VKDLSSPRCTKPVGINGAAILLCLALTFLCSISFSFGQEPPEAVDTSIGPLEKIEMRIKQAAQTRPRGAYIPPEKEKEFIDELHAIRSNLEVFIDKNSASDKINKARILLAKVDLTEYSFRKNSSLLKSIEDLADKVISSDPSQVEELIAWRYRIAVAKAENDVKKLKRYFRTLALNRYMLPGVHEALSEATFSLHESGDIDFIQEQADSIMKRAPRSPAALWARACRMHFQIGKTLSFPVSKTHQFHIGRLHGKVLLIQFWSTRDAGVGEMPDLVRLRDRYHKQGFGIIGVNLDVNRSAFLRFNSENVLPGVHHHDSKGLRGRLPRLYGIPFTPYNFLISRKGEVVAENVYGQELEGRIKTEIAKPLPPGAEPVKNENWAELEEGLAPMLPMEVEGQ